MAKFIKTWIRKAGQKEFPLYAIHPNHKPVAIQERVSASGLPR